MPATGTQNWVARGQVGVAGLRCVRTVLDVPADALAAQPTESPKPSAVPIEKIRSSKGFRVLTLVRD